MIQGMDGGSSSRSSSYECITSTVSIQGVIVGSAGSLNRNSHECVELLDEWLKLPSDIVVEHPQIFLHTHIHRSQMNAHIFQYVRVKFIAENFKYHRLK